MIESSPPSSSSSAESSFRELDEVFLQTQTRIWLGELLNTRLDEDLPLPDLLHDGEILFQVSRVVWDFLMIKCMELRHLKHKYGPFASKKSSGRYRPYSNVDSFLKVCKILGLNGIDLFSPSDVVEKRNIRKVCICIRALSKKARSKQLSVPDFDMVMYSVTMPTDMVGVIRRSLESPQCTSSNSSIYGSHKGSKTKLKKSNLYAPVIRDDDSSSSDESDEAESLYMGEHSFSSPSNFNNADGVSSNLEDSPESGFISGQYSTKNFVESDVKCKSDSDIDKDASCRNVSKKISYGSSYVNGEDRQTNSNGNVDVSSVNFTPENDDPYMGDSSCIEVGENNYIANYLAFSDLMVHAIDGSNSVVRDGENNMFDFFLNVDPQGATMGERSFHNGSQRVYSDDEDMEVSSTTSMSSVLGRLLNLELDNQYDEDDSLSTNVNSSASKELESRKLYNDAPVLSEPPKEGTFQTQRFNSQEAGFKRATRLPSSERCLASQEEGELPILERSKDGKGAGNNVPRDVTIANDDPERPLSGEDDDKATEGAVILGSDEDTVEPGGSVCLEFSNKSKLVEDVAFQGINIQDATPHIVSGKTNTYSSILQMDPHETVSARVQVEHTSTAQEDSSAENNISPTHENGDQEKREKDKSDSQPQTTKHEGNPLLKTVVKGTAIAGVIFLLLYIKKTNANSAQERQQNPQTLKYNRSKPSSGKQQTRSVGKGIYPTEKLKL